ncbi:hypothetical protein TNCV_5030611 [Trichonephila clavipes]|nr:hypothetical protein TNCV_5030611 [Trichonephila clavipes]
MHHSENEMAFLSRDQNNRHPFPKSIQLQAKELQRTDKSEALLAVASIRGKCKSYQLLMNPAIRNLSPSHRKGVQPVDNEIIIEFA